MNTKIYLSSKAAYRVTQVNRHRKCHRMVVSMVDTVKANWTYMVRWAVITVHTCIYCTGLYTMKVFDRILAVQVNIITVNMTCSCRSIGSWNTYQTLLGKSSPSHSRTQTAPVSTNTHSSLSKITITITTQIYIAPLQNGRERLTIKAMPMSEYKNN